MIGPLAEVIVHVDDMAVQTAFYRDVLGLELERESEWWTTFRTGACTFALHGGGRIGTANSRAAFLVDDVAAERERLLGQGVEMTEIREPAPGILVADGTDPEGNGFSIEQRV